MRVLPCLAVLLLATPLAGQTSLPRDSAQQAAVARARDAKDYAGAIPLLEAVVARRPTDAFAWYWLGESFLRTQRPGEATAALRQALTHDTAYDAFPTWFRLGTGYAARRTGDPALRRGLRPDQIAAAQQLMRDSAVAAYRRAAELEPRGTTALEALLRLVEGAEAEQVRAAIAAKNPEQARMRTDYLNMRTAADAGRWREAATAQAAIVARDSTDAKAWADLAELRLRVADTAGSLQAAQGAVTAKADAATLQRLGELFVNARPSVARQLLGRSLAASNDTTARLMLALGRALVLEGRAEQGLAVLQRGVRADSTNAALWAEAGVALGQLNRWPQAAALLGRAVRLADDTMAPQYRYLEGVAAHKAGNTALADRIEGLLNTEDGMLWLMRLREARKTP